MAAAKTISITSIGSLTLHSAAEPDVRLDELKTESGSDAISQSHDSELDGGQQLKFLVETPLPEVVENPYVPPKQYFIWLNYQNKKKVMLNTLCRKGILLKHLTELLQLHKGDVFRLDFVSLHGQLLYFGDNDFDTECNHIFPEGGHTFLPVLVYKDEYNGELSMPQTAGNIQMCRFLEDDCLASVHWLVNKVEELYPKAVEGINNEIRLIQKEKENRLLKEKEKEEKEEQYRLEKLAAQDKGNKRKKEVRRSTSGNSTRF